MRIVLAVKHALVIIPLIINLAPIPFHGGVRHDLLHNGRKCPDDIDLTTRCLFVVTLVLEVVSAVAALVVPYRVKAFRAAWDGKSEVGGGDGGGGDGGDGGGGGTGDGGGGAREEGGEASVEMRENRDGEGESGAHNVTGGENGGGGGGGDGGGGMDTDPTMLRGLKHLRRFLLVRLLCAEFIVSILALLAGARALSMPCI